MAETVGGLKVTVSIQGSVIGDDGALLKVDKEFVYRFTNGTGSNQVGNIWQDESRALNATSEDLNVDGITDFQGAATGFNNLKLMCFKNLDTDTGDNLTIGGASSNQLVNWVSNGPDEVVVGPGGLFLLISPVDGYGVTASTGDLLKLACNDNSTFYALLAGDNA
jgi:hypothetical protein